MFDQYFFWELSVQIIYETMVFFRGSVLIVPILGIYFVEAFISHALSFQQRLWFFVDWLSGVGCTMGIYGAPLYVCLPFE